MKKVIVIMLSMLLVHGYKAQLDKDVWLVTGYKHLGDNFKRYKLGFSFDARNTFVGQNRSKIGGLKLGVYINRVHQIGIGLYGMNKAIQINRIPDSQQPVDAAFVSLTYSSVFYERVLYFDRKWEWSSAVHLGSGEIKMSYRVNREDDLIPLVPIRTKPFELSTSTYYHLYYWLSVGGGVGYRWMRKTPDEYQPFLDGSIYLIKVKIRIGRLVKSIFNEDVKDEY